MEKLDQFHIHEALHTTHLAVCFVEDNLSEHCLCKSNINPKFNAKIDEAIKALSEAYQIVGSIELGDEN